MMADRKGILAAVKATHALINKLDKMNREVDCANNALFAAGASIKRLQDFINLRSA